jgi:hypothetical protein
MAIISHIDGETRRIYLHSDTVGVDLQPMSIYQEMRALRSSDETLRKYDVFLRAYGHVAKGGGKYTERYVQEVNGTRIVPFDISQILNVIGVIITDDGQEGVACFDRSLLSPAAHVDINYVPKQVEIIEISTGSSALTPAQETQLDELHQAHYHKRKWDKVGNTITIYADDGITPLHVFDTNSDMSEITPQ